MNYIFIGFKSVGKSTIGKSFSEALKFNFIDLDRVIEEIDNNGRSCREIFNQSGSDYFRELETKALISLKNENNSVIALGGGALENKDNHQLIKELGTIIYLICSQQTLFDRIKKDGLPKFIDSLETFQKLYKQRSTIYEALANLNIDCTHKSVEEITQEIISKTTD